MFNLESIQTYREQSGLSQSQLGDRLGVTGQTVAAWEKGDRDLSVAQLLRLAQVLGESKSKKHSGNNGKSFCWSRVVTRGDSFTRTSGLSKSFLTRLERLVYLALLREEITLSRAAEILGKPLVQVRTVFQQWLEEGKF